MKVNKVPILRACEFDISTLEKNKLKIEKWLPIFMNDRWDHSNLDYLCTHAESCLFPVLFLLRTAQYFQDDQFKFLKRELSFYSSVWAGLPVSDLVETSYSSSGIRDFGFPCRIVSVNDIKDKFKPPPEIEYTTVRFMTRFVESKIKWEHKIETLPFERHLVGIAKDQVREVVKSAYRVFLEQEQADFSDRWDLALLEQHYSLFKTYLETKSTTTKKIFHQKIPPYLPEHIPPCMINVLATPDSLLSEKHVYIVCNMLSKFGMSSREIQKEFARLWPLYKGDEVTIEKIEGCTKYAPCTCEKMRNSLPENPCPFFKAGLDSVKDIEDMCRNESGKGNSKYLKWTPLNFYLNKVYSKV